MNDSKNLPGSKPMSRRSFVKGFGTGLLMMGTVGSGMLAGMMSDRKGNTQAATSPAAHSAPVFTDALMFFTKEQFQWVEAVTERIFPYDELGPGAKALGVAIFIDHQLAGPWGINAREYMAGPFQPGSPTQGTQTHLTHQQIYLNGIQAVSKWCQSKYQKGFVELAQTQQDEVLTAMEKGEIPILKGYSSQAFFEVLKANTLEGVYSDPLYGGNPI
ncbi:gluconate 2-dehydrogenase subunit 3 family protein [Brevibacillus nitrificans]|uniref:gluconate 2-dehydrogenase subunit 3 family protein n=1 Tax=Brevibacillus nitrificans TaxID=651560 RepID=UPI002E20966F|nr:gluconate 2-dehydrogenase subunit 3 family protein [Brevibacillus nitrificans]